MDFLDKMKDGISKGIDTIGAKGKEIMENTQAQLQISSLRDKRKKAVEELGALAYGLYQQGALTAAEAKTACESIAALDQEIAAKQEELKHESAAGNAAGTALVKCDCGAEHAPGASFCSSCGKKLV